MSKVTAAQERMLWELFPSADNAERMWYFRTARTRKTIECLARLNLVDMQRDAFATGARLTLAGLRHIGVDGL